MLYCHDIIIINISITKINIAELSTFIFTAFRIPFIFSKAKNIIKYVLKNPEICLCSLSKSLFSIKSTHTTYMATYIAGKNGIAPNAKILSISLNGTPVNEIDWMVDNDVDIINMSYCEATPTGVYSSESAYVDYIAYTEKVVMIAAAGNESGNGGTGYLGNPALALNAITVGSTNHFNNAVAGFSSHVVADYSSDKPTLCVVG